jgi:nitrite reductase/ring-hydroxylating ferredoxin subunit
MTDADWQIIDGVDPATADFPARARIADEQVVVFRLETGYRAVQRRCPHQDFDFIDAQLMGRGDLIRCAGHSYIFRVDNGKGVNCPGYEITVFEVVAEDGALKARRRVDKP